MKLAYTLLILLLLNVIVEAQTFSPKHFPLQDENLNVTESSLVQAVNGDLLMFWYSRNLGTIFYSTSINDGATWMEKKIIADRVYLDVLSKHSLSCLVLNSGRILFLYKGNLLIYSDDHGETWSDPLPLLAPHLDQNLVINPSLSLTSDGRAAFVYNRRSQTSYEPRDLQVVFSSNGIDWSTIHVITTSGINGNLVSLNDSLDMIVYEDLYYEPASIFKRITTDGGITWSNPEIIISDSLGLSSPNGIIDHKNVISIYFLKKDKTAFKGIYQSEIYFIKSTDAGLNWSQPEKFTHYAGIDTSFHLSIFNNLPIVTFISTRNFDINRRTLQVFYGNQYDVSSPPYLYLHTQNPASSIVSQPVYIKAFVDDNSVIDSVKMILTKDLTEVDTLKMFDDGLHNDSLSNDQIYGIELGGFIPGNGVQYNFLIYDSEMNIAGFNGGEINIPLDFNVNNYRVKINNIEIPIDNTGILGDVYSIEGLAGGRIDDKLFLYSGGFFLSGKNNDKIWSTAQASASRIQDYQPGTVGSSSNHPKNQLYVIQKSDPPFGETWQNYIYAVQNGADFYDGNGDRIYNPIDLNGNSIWDPDEDKPDLIGDLTAWCIYNDGVPSDLRVFNSMIPLGIEIHQSVFVFKGDNSGYDGRDYTIFVRYKILNTGKVSNTFDSVYFGGWADSDLGEANEGYFDDLPGCDTILNSGYIYNDGEDGDWGINPPTHLIKILQGPYSYIPGETYTDNNLNNEYDEGTDTPLDSAFNYKGEFGIDIIPGAKNLGISSFIHYMSGRDDLDEPDTHIEARQYMLGKNKHGEYLDPCTWVFGDVLGGVNCSQVNPSFMYSGDPVTQYGWVNNFPYDQRQLTNTGPFMLEADKPVNIIVAHIAGRGYDALNSLTKARSFSSSLDGFLKSNFTDIVVSVDDEIEDPILYKFALHQNYPNPFNPVTIIRYQIPETGKVTLKIFDILGQEVKTLVDKEQFSGNYEVHFDGSNLSSGIYFYELKTENFSSVKKMILLK